MCHWRCGKCNKREIKNKGEYNGTNHFLVKEKEKNQNEKMWSVLPDVPVLSGVQRRWRAIKVFSRIEIYDFRKRRKKI